MDQTSYAAPARVNALVLPVGTLRLSEFERYYARLCRASDVQLIDVHLPPPRDESTAAVARHFDPHANPTGRVVFDFRTETVPQFQRPLFDLEPWRQQLCVIGIASWDAVVNEDVPALINELRRRYASSVYHAILVFGAPADHGSVTREWPGSAVFPIVKSNFTSLESHLSTLTGEFLARLSIFWSTRHLSSFQSPAALIEKTVPIQSHPHHPDNPGKAAHHRHTASTATIGRNGSISMGSTERAKSRQEGRTLKYLGNLYLLSGLVTDALAEFGAAATILKEQSDHLWFASVLSDIALCLVILRLEGTPAGVPSPAVSAASALASRQTRRKSFTPTTTTTPSGSPGPGSGSGGPGGGAASATGSGGELNVPRRVSSLSSRHQRGPSIASTETAATTEERPSLSLASAGLRKSRMFSDQTPVEELIEYLMLAVLEEYSYGRGAELVSHTVYYETVARFVNLLICLTGGWTKHALAAAVRGSTTNQLSTPASPLVTPQSTPKRSRPVTPKGIADIGVTDTGDTEAFTSVPPPSTAMIERWISKVYDLSLSELGPDTQARILGTVAGLYARAGLRRKWAFACTQIVSLLASSRATVDAASLGQIDEVLAAYSRWPKLEASLLRNLVALGQRTHNPRLQTDAASRLLAMVCERRLEMVDKEQMTMYHLIRSYGDVVQSRFWDPRVVISSSVKTHHLTQSAASRAASRKASLQPITTTTLAAVTVTPPTTEDKPPAIIYNPFDAPANNTNTKDEGSIERGIPTNARIILRNPLAVDISVFELALVDSKGKFVSEIVKDIVIPANAVQHRVDATVLPGADDELVLEIAGCYIQVSGCISQTIELPPQTQPPIRVPIIPARPVLVLQSLSLLKGCTMMLEGESQRISIVLWNSSQQTPAEVLHFGFNDSTTSDPLVRHGSRQQDVSRAELYEYEYLLHRRRAIDLVGSTEHQPIAPQTSQTFEFDIYGKRGVDSAAILVDYGLTEDSLRRLKIPLQITICPSINIERASILPMDTNSTVLLVLDVRNSWRQRLRCRFWATSTPPATTTTSPNESDNETTTDAGDSDTNDSSSECVEAEIDPGSLQRVFVVVPWSPLTLEEMEKPIPSFSQRQFTVDTRTSPEQLQLFWLREKLLSKLHGEWFCDSDGRRGYVELRSIQLTRRMAEVLKTSVVEVRAHPLNTAQIDVPTMLVLSVENKSQSPVKGMLRLIPNKAALRYMLVMGVSQQLVTVPAASTVNIEFMVLFLSHGTFEISSVLDPVPTSQRLVSSGTSGGASAATTAPSSATQPRTVPQLLMSSVPPLPPVPNTSQRTQSVGSGLMMNPNTSSTTITTTTSISTAPPSFSASPGHQSVFQTSKTVITV